MPFVEAHITYEFISKNAMRLCMAYSLLWLFIYI